MSVCHVHFVYEYCIVGIFLEFHWYISFSLFINETCMSIWQLCNSFLNLATNPSITACFYFGPNNFLWCLYVCVNLVCFASSFDFSLSLSSKRALKPFWVNPYSKIESIPFFFSKYHGNLSGFTIAILSMQKITLAYLKSCR